MKQAVFRVDVSTVIGSGHLSRCLTLAQHLSPWRIHFICRHLPETYHRLIEAAGHTVHRLPPESELFVPVPACVSRVPSFPSSNDAFSLYPGKDGHGPGHARGHEFYPVPHAHWLGVSWEEDAAATLSILKTLPELALMVVDHYGLDARFERLMRPWVKQLVVIDDLADRPHACDVLLDQTMTDPARYEPWVSPETLCLLGPRYALLRPAFQAALLAFPRSERPLQAVKRVVICFGGMDTHNETLKVLTALTPWFSSLEIEVILGPSAPHQAALGAWMAAHSSLSLHIAPPDFEKRLAAADLSLGAAGTLVWERAVLGLPSLTVALAENQRKMAADLARQGVHLYLGDSQTVSVSDWQTAFAALLQNPLLRQSLADRSLQLTDGRGASRLARVLKMPDIHFRKATVSDCQRIFEWRNDPLTRKFTPDPLPLAYETHETWFNTVLAASDRCLLIGFDEAGALGVVRFDRQKDRWVISIYLVPARHGEGLGTPLLKKSVAWLREHQPDALPIYAEIQPENIASQEIFKRAGFKQKTLMYVG